jgi:hypothetical protein
MASKEDKCEFHREKVFEAGCAFLTPSGLCENLHPDCLYFGQMCHIFYRNSVGEAKRR